ncbi:MAG: metallophosphoesterase [Gemmatimonadota bacterium]
MRTVVQLSDLHFGTTIAATLDPLIQLLQKLRPDLVIVSGDLTQRAKTQQFVEARAYLDRLPAPRLVIPGNHDVPLYDIARRFLSPLGRYRTHISNDLAPVFLDDEIAVVGINTARSLTFKGGRIGRSQLATSTAYLDALPPHVARIVVTHHPFDIPVGLSGVAIVHGAERAIDAFARCDVDLVLSGHLHLVHVASTAKYVAGYDAPMLVAGTAVSTRARGEPNSFFVFRVDRQVTECDTYTWDEETTAFQQSDTRTFARVSGQAASPTWRSHSRPSIP